MATFTFGKDTSPLNQSNFIELGESLIDKPLEIIEEVSAKLRRQLKTKPQAIWATLGWEDNSTFHPYGTVSFSEKGTTEHGKVSGEQVEAIKLFNPLANNPDFEVKERYINFDEVDFGFQNVEFTLDDIPRLQLTVFMNPDEGAIVYYQHSKKGNYDDSEADIEYILPESTGSQHDTKNRDRLKYYITLLPEEVEEIPGVRGYVKRTGNERQTSFIIKVLTFKRNTLKAKELLVEAFNTLNIKKSLGQAVTHYVGQSKYEVLLYNKQLNDFKSVDEQNQIDYTKRTLILVHGTFSTTEGSYGGLYHSKFSTGTDFLKSLLDTKVYDQIIGFNHPTISDDAFSNAKTFYKLLDKGVFTKPVDLIGTSRGALLAKWMACDPLNNSFKVRKVLTFSAANGVGYYDAGKKINMALKVWKRVAGPESKAIAVFAQFSVEFFLELPGNRQMTPGSERLKKILDSTPKNPNTRFKAVAADWSSELPTVLKLKPLDVALDAAIKLFLGSEHDWVVGFEAQKITPADYSDQPVRITSMHVKNLDLSYVNTNTHEIIRNYMST